MKRKVDWDEKEESFYEDTNASENEESDNEEPRVKDVLENLSKTVSRERAADLLHSLAASKDILFWTRLIQNKRILAEVLEKEQAYRDKDSEASDEEMVSESSDNEDDTDTASK